MLLYLYPIEKQFTFKKEERLKSHKLIEQLFSKAKSFSIFPLKALYQFTDLPAGIFLQTGVAVSKKNFRKAVDRNRIKRILREAYRLQKLELQNSLSDSSKQLALFLIYTGKELADSTDVMEKVNTVLQHLTTLVKEEGK